MFSGTLIEEMVKQSQNIEPGVFLCEQCTNYKGALVCQKGVFIAFEGANLSHCSFFWRGRKCPHCGRVITLQSVGMSIGGERC